MIFNFMSFIFLKWSDFLDLLTCPKMVTQVTGGARDLEPNVLTFP